MLTSDQFEALVIPFTDLYEEYQTAVINDIARRIVKLDITSASAWQLQKLIESGKVYENALAEISKLTGISEKELTVAFKKAGVQTMRFDDSIYKAAGLDPVPLNQSPAMAQVLATTLARTNGIVNNLTLTTAIDAQQKFIRAADIAFLQVTSGTMSYDQAIRAAVNKTAVDGLSVIYPTGYTDKVDVAMRRTVLTGVSQVSGQLQLTRAQEMGQDLVQTSAHFGARPSHAEWQGMIFSRTGISNKYPDFIEGTGYGTGAGLGGWNCRHSFYPFFEGISENAYNKATRNSLADRTVTLNGATISMYKATQQQRYIERGIRSWKRRASALDAAGLDNIAATAKVREWQARMRDFTRQTGLSRQYVREQI